MHRMGETVSEQLHIEVKAAVLQHVRFKYTCRHCERTALHTPIVIAPMPAQPLPGSVATPSTLALVLANKYVDGTRHTAGCAKWWWRSWVLALTLGGPMRA